MFKSRLTIGGAMIAVGVLAVEFAALRAASPFWLSAIYTLTIVGLLLATIAARYRRGDARAFWFGASLFGWVYLLLALGPWSFPSSPDDRELEGIRPDLLTSRLVWSILGLIRGKEDDYESVKPAADSTVGVAHLMITLIVAIVGGYAALASRRWRNRKAAASASTSKVRGAAVIALAGLVFAGALAFGGLSQREYFSPLAFDKQQESNQFIVDWYSKHLKAMSEPSLWEMSKRDTRTTTYRLLWLPSFNHPACIRVSKSGDVATIRVVVLDGQGGYSPGLVAVDKTRRLTDSDWQSIEKQVDRMNFWKLPTTLDDDAGTDGDQLILEGVRPGQYHIVDRWEPDDEYLKTCLLLAGFANVRIEKTLASYHTASEAK